MDIESAKNKSNFVVTLLGSMLAVSTFKDELRAISISFGFYKSNFLQLSVVFCITLLMSAYLFALDYARYDTKSQDSPIFRWIFPIANLFYIAALILPIFFLVIWLGNIILSSIEIQSSDAGNILTIGTILSTIVGSSTAYFFSQIAIRNYRSELAMVFERAAEIQLQKATKLYKNGFYSESILELHKVLESNVRGILQQKGYFTEHTPAYRVIDFAIKEKIIPKDFSNDLISFYGMRNSAAHLSISHTIEDADFAFHLTKQVLDVLSSYKSK